MIDVSSIAASLQALLHCSERVYPRPHAKGSMISYIDVYSALAAGLLLFSSPFMAQYEGWAPDRSAAQACEARREVACTPMVSFGRDIIEA